VADAEAEFQRILQCVQENFPAETYMTNEFLPDPDAPWEPMECAQVDSIRVGMPWVLNDEEAPWYNAVEQGYYADVCLDVELVPGGPGINQLQVMAGGAIDIAVQAAGSEIPSFVASPTPADIVAVGTFLKHSPYIWLGLDPSVAQDQTSSLELTPEDFVGKKVGLQPGNEYFAEFLAAKYNLPLEEIDLMEAGFTPDPLLVGAMDYVGAWIVNQPRLLEEQGYMNWVAFPFAEWGWDGYSDVSAVRREMLESNPDLVRRYLAATYQGVKFLLENPEESAAIAVEYGVDAQLTPEQALRRFELQAPLVEGTDGLPLMHMTPDAWNNLIAVMVQYGQLELEACQ
jgi:ABC-type nitrate/sulfonate/bicarbonate transport system substrate-binding protein